MTTFTATDLEKAKKAMNEAYDTYLQRKDRYDYSISKGHYSYAKKHHLKPMQEAEEGYNLAAQHYNNIIQAIDAESNQQFKNVERNFITDQFTDVIETDTSINTAQNINWPLIGIVGGAVILIIIIFKIL